MAAAVHGAGGRLAVQLAHAGGQNKASWLGAGRVPLGPSALTHPVSARRSTSWAANR